MKQGSHLFFQLLVVVTVLFSMPSISAFRLQAHTLRSYGNRYNVARSIVSLESAIGSPYSKTHVYSHNAPQLQQHGHVGRTSKLFQRVFRSHNRNVMSMLSSSTQSSVATPTSSSSSSPSSYNHAMIEPKWQAYWDEHRIFESKRRIGHPKKYVLDMFPYPSGAGLHVGHPEGYTATDIMARFWRMQGYDVLHPMGWDAFGLPAEQHAINTGTHPEVTTKHNIATFKRQLKSLGFSYDWSRELSTTDDNYVRWTQWIFLQLFKKGLASQSEISVNWCPALGTVLANEEIIDGLSERGNHPVVRMPLRQWVLKITQYADKLEEGLENMQWPEGTLSAQKQWIGRSKGANIKFRLEKPVQASSSSSNELEVFTTRPDTLMGVTYVVLAPEHSLVPHLTTSEQKEQVSQYLSSITGKSDMERTSTGKDRGKTGVFTGSYAVHPISGEKIPIWIADYVLASYGTGIVMAVPAHDERDYIFAEKFNLPMKRVVKSLRTKEKDGQDVKTDKNTNTDTEDEALPMVDEGIVCNSGVMFDGLTTEKCKEAVVKKLQDLGSGGEQITFKLRDWVFSRQRYWGEPIPIYFPVEMLEDKDDATSGGGKKRSPAEGAPHRIAYENPIPVDDKDLPLRLPDMTDFQPGDDPQGCLARATHWRYFEKDGKWFARETNTMPQWAGSCWYYLRFTDPNNKDALLSKVAASWLPVDLYIGGQEHAVLHLLYARFWHKVLYDIGVVDHPEPFTKLVHQGMILGTDGEKMSKSRGNVINPDDVVKEHGADALRLYEMFMGPLEAVKPWQTGQLAGVVRFRDRVYNLIAAATSAPGKMTDQPVTGNLSREMHKTTKKVTQDIEKLGFNTAISNLMIYSNTLSSHLSSEGSLPREAIERIVLLLSPFAPHVAEEAWQVMLGHKRSISLEEWPKYDESLCIDTTATVAIQVNGKVRGKAEMELDLAEAAALELAMQQPSVSKYTNGMQVAKVIYVPGRILNIIVKK